MEERPEAYVVGPTDKALLYKGACRNLVSRLADHRAGRVSRTKNHRPLYLFYFEYCDDYTQALKREKFFKTGAGAGISKLQHLKSGLSATADQPEAGKSVVRKGVWVRVPPRAPVTDDIRRGHNRYGRTTRSLCAWPTRQGPLSFMRHPYPILVVLILCFSGCRVQDQQLSERFAEGTVTSNDLVGIWICDEDSEKLLSDVLRPHTIHQPHRSHPGAEC